MPVPGVPTGDRKGSAIGFRCHGNNYIDVEGSDDEPEFDYD